MTNTNARVFYQNYLVGTQLASATASSGDIETTYDNNPDSYWISVGSDDSTTETLTYEFAEPMNIDRLMLIYNNWKEFNCQYWNGSAFVDFSTPVIETTNDNAFLTYTFDEVSTTQIKFSITKSFVVDDEKEIAQIFITKDIGQFVDDIASKPNKVKVSYTTGEKVQQLSNEGSKLILRGNKIKIQLTIKSLSETIDKNIIKEMYALRECAIALGGLVDHYDHEGWRQQDIYNCIVTKDYMADHNVGRVKAMGYDYKINLLEV